jgi:flagellar basal-body rod protein FlgF
MASSIQALSSALRSDQEALATVSNNISNLSTPGFKKAYATVSSNSAAKASALSLADQATRQTSLADQATRQTSLADQATRQTSLADQATRQISLSQNSRSFEINDFSPGPQKITGSNLDLSINGAGFFVLAKPDGAEVLTRDGQFTLNSSGNLVNSMGDKLMSETGELIVSNSDFLVQDDGTVTVNGAPAGRIKVRLAPDLQRIDQSNQFQSQSLEAPQVVSISQGKLEGSNVSSADEMVRVITISRHIESVQRALSIYDRTLDVGINRLGEN